MSRARDMADLGAVTARLDTVGGSSGALSNRRLTINGAMQVAQRATSATAVSGAGVYDTIDRLKLWKDNDGAYTSEQSTTAPDGFGNSVKFQVTTADTSIAAAQYSCIAQIIEAQNLQHLSYGTSAAKDITVSFYVRSNKTGTYGFSIEKNDSTRYIFVKEFTIDAADTWERKIITISPDSNIKASGGAIANNNGNGFRAFIFLASGSDYHGTNNVWNTNTSAFTTSNQVNWMDSTSNNFYLTGMQLEVGDTATDFEHRSFGDELARCQRYTYVVKGDDDDHTGYIGYSESTANARFGVLHPVTMRAAPSFTFSGTCRAQGGTNDSANFTSNLNIANANTSNTGATIRVTGTSGLGAADRGYNLQFKANGSSLTFDAEL